MKAIIERHTSEQCGSVPDDADFRAGLVLAVDSMVFEILPTAVVCFCRWTYESFSEEIAYFFVALFKASFAFQCVFSVGTYEQLSFLC